MRVIEEIMLNFASIQGNNNKFYKMRLAEENGDFKVEIVYGRLGQSGQRSVKSFNSEGLAQKLYNSKLHEKLKKGYVEVELVTSKTSKPKVNSSTDRTSDIKQIKKVDDSTSLVYNMLINFLGSSRTYMKEHVNLPLGSLSPNQIIKGYSILETIERALRKNASESDLIRLSDEFYRVFPVIFGRNNDNLIINTLAKLGDKRNLVDIAKSVVKTSELDNIEEVYDSLQMKIRPLSKTTQKYEEIVNRVHRTQSDKHRFDIKVKNVYEINKPEWDDKFNPHKVRVNLLYHGSRTENFLNILQSGLRIKPPGAAHTGSMFGNGIYFADQSTKSANYCWGFNRVRGTFYMMVCEVAVGKMFDLQHADSSIRSAPKGYNSVRGVKGSSLLHNEVIVYNESQANIRYIIEFEV